MKYLKNLVIKLLSYKKIKYSLLLIIIVIIIKFPVYIVNGKSMIPTLHNHQIVIGNRYLFAKKYEINNIVVVHKDNKNYIKRIVAVEGDAISCVNNNLKINDTNMSNYYCENIENTVLKENEYFVLGDNGPQSIDSRSFGVVKIDEIKSKIRRK
ncbi:MAG: signal peptidase I [Mycoplasmatales bacterium]